MNDNVILNAPMGATLQGPTPKNPFEYQKPTEEHVEKITQVREGCKTLHQILLSLPYSRERVVAITKLEEVSMWANKGIVFN